jgi:hypothetical protein
VAESSGCLFLRSNVTKKAVDGGKSVITCSNPVSAGGFEAFKESQHGRRIQAGEFKSRHAAFRAGCCET